MAVQENFIVADAARVTGADKSRISDISAGLGIQRRRTGRNPKQLTMENAIRICAVRQLQAEGVLLNAAISAVKKVSFEALKEIIKTDQQTWIVVTPDGAAAVADINRLAELAVEHGSIRNLKIVNLRSIIEDLFVARLERLEAQKADGSLVQPYVASEGESGCLLHRSLKLAVVKDGRGLAIRLSPGEARNLAANLVKLADEAEKPPAREQVN